VSPLAALHPHSKTLRNQPQCIRVVRVFLRGPALKTKNANLVAGFAFDFRSWRLGSAQQYWRRSADAAATFAQ